MLLRDGIDLTIRAPTYRLIKRVVLHVGCYPNMSGTVTTNYGTIKIIDEGWTITIEDIDAESITLAGTSTYIIINDSGAIISGNNGARTYRSSGVV